MGILVFASYATEDTEFFQVSRVAESLTHYAEIDDVLYWEEDLDDDIYEYMNRNIKKCDVFILFCSEHIEESEAVNIEWMAALKLKKKIIPIFIKESYIPPLLSTKFGIPFDRNTIDEIIKKLYRLILKKYKSRKKERPIISEKLKSKEITSLDKEKVINIRLRIVGDYYIKIMEISGFTSYGNATSISLSPNITFLVGPNGSGKSNFIKAILFALESFKENLLDIENLLYNSYKNKKDIAKEAKITLQFDNRRGFFPHFPFFNLTRILQRNTNHIRKINNIIVSESEYKNALSTTDIDNSILSTLRFFLNPTKIGEFVNSNPNNRLKYIGQLIGAYNAKTNNWLLRRFKDNFNLINEQLKKLYLKYNPEESVEIEISDDENLSSGGLFIKIKKTGGVTLSFEDLSGGSKDFVFLMLYFAILRIFPSPIYFFDEIDISFDATILKRLSSILRDFATNSQIIFTSRKFSTEFVGLGLIYGVAKISKDFTDIFRVEIESNK